jgi:hypothetical protein
MIEERIEAAIAGAGSPKEVDSPKPINFGALTIKPHAEPFRVSYPTQPDAENADLLETAQGIGAGSGGLGGLDHEDYLPDKEEDDDAGEDDEQDPYEDEEPVDEKLAHNLLAAKTYAVLAVPKIKDAAESHEHFISAAKDFFLAFAEDGFDDDEQACYDEARGAGLEPPKIALEDQYKRLAVDLWTKANSDDSPGSLGPYVLKHLDELIHSDDGVLEPKRVSDSDEQDGDYVGGMYMVPSTDAFGMQNFDPLLSGIGVSMHQYKRKYLELASQKYLPHHKAKATLEQMFQIAHPGSPLPNHKQDLIDAKVLEEMTNASTVTPTSPAGAPPPPPQEAAAAVPPLMKPGERLSIVVQVKTKRQEQVKTLDADYPAMLPNITFVTMNDVQYGPYTFVTPVPLPGEDDLLSFCTEQDAALWQEFGNVREVRLAANDANSWHFQKVRVRVAGSRYPWVNFEAGKWLDGSVDTVVRRSDGEHSPHWALHPIPESTSPTPSPTDAPTKAPTTSPTDSPTDAPTTSPTGSPTESPTESPTDAPTESPTESPTGAPTDSPTDAPTSLAPTAAPTPAWVVNIMAATGDIKFAKTTMKPKVTLVGTDGEATLEITAAPQGQNATTSSRINEIGEIQEVKLEKTNNNAWFFSKLAVQVQGGEWQYFGSALQWLGKPGQHSGYPYANSITLLPETSEVSITVHTGKEQVGTVPSHAAVSITGSKGSKRLEVGIGAKSKTTTVSSIDLGDIHSVVVQATSEDAWLCEQLAVNGATFGPLPVFLATNGTQKAKLNGMPLRKTMHLQPASHALMIKATTGNRENAESSGHPSVTIVGDEGEYTTTFNIGKRGVEQVTHRLTSAIGKPQKVILHATSNNKWFFTNFEVKTDSQDGFLGFGPTSQWLQSKPYHPDKANYEGYAHGNKIALKPRNYKTLVSVTTAFDYNAESNATVQLRFRGSEGKSSWLALSGLPAQGKSKLYTFYTVGVGTIEAAHLHAASTDGWMFSMFKVQQGESAKFIEFGPSHQWAVGQPYGTPRSFSFYPFDSELVLTPAYREFHLKYTTSPIEPKASKQQPRVTFMGTVGNQTFHLQNVPAPGDTEDHKFMITDIGEVLGVTLKADNGDPWLATDLLYKEVLTPQSISHSDTTKHRKDQYVYGSEHDQRNAPLPYVIQEEIRAANASADLPVCTVKSCCKIKIYKAPKPAEGRRRRRRKVQDWRAKKLEKTVEKCSYTGEAPVVKYSGKIKAFELSGQCEKVTLYDYDPKKKKKSQDNDVTYTRSQDKIAKDLRNDISGFKLYIKNKNDGECKDPSKQEDDSILVEAQNSDGTVNPDETDVSEALEVETPWQPLGSNEYLAQDVDFSDKNGFDVEREEIARPVGTGCACIGQSQQWEVAETRFGDPEVGGHCAYWLTTDVEPWCYVPELCSGHVQTTKAGNDVYWYHCPTPLAKIPVKVALKLAAGSSVDGAASFQLEGQEGRLSEWQSIDGSTLAAGQWNDLSLFAPVEMEEVLSIHVKFTPSSSSSSSCFSWEQINLQFAGGFVHAFTPSTDAGLCSATDSQTLEHHAPGPSGTASLKIKTKDARTGYGLSGVNFMVVNFKLMGTTRERLVSSLEGARNEVVNALEERAEMSEEEQLAAIRKIVLEQGGATYGGGARFLPVGFTVAEAGRWASSTTISGLGEGADQMLLLFKKGYLFSWDFFSTEGPGSTHSMETFMSPSLKHGQMLITLQWGASPSDLDLYVVAPKEMSGAESATEIGGGKPEEAAQENDEPGQTINWMDRGDEHVYPYVVLDTDATWGKGPETMTVHKPITGTYRVYVDCYSCRWSQNYAQFKNSGATIRIFDRYGIVDEFKIADAEGTPSQYWGIAKRKCSPPPALDTTSTQEGFANRDNVWTFYGHNHFSSSQPIFIQENPIKYKNKYKILKGQGRNKYLSAPAPLP